MSVRLIEVKSLVSVVSGSLPGRHALGQLLFMELLEIVRDVTHLHCHALEGPGMPFEGASTRPDHQFVTLEVLEMSCLLGEGRG